MNLYWEDCGPFTGRVCLTPGKTFQQDSSEQSFLPSVAFWVAVTDKGQAASSILHPSTRPPIHSLLGFPANIFSGPGPCQVLGMQWLMRPVPVELWSQPTLTL